VSKSSFFWSSFQSGAAMALFYARRPLWDCGEQRLYSKTVALETKKRDRRRFPWLLPLLLILAGIYLFWVMPYQQGRQKVEVEFEQPAQSE
jgi:hypothetical protein